MSTATKPDATRGDIRGSSLLLGGRLISKLANFGIQVLIVRELTRDNFGAFAYAMALVDIAQVAVAFGMNRAMPRFLPIYRQNGQMNRFYGAMVLCALSIAALSVVLLSGVWLAAPTLGGGLIRSHLAVSCLVVLVCLAPLLAIDDVLISILATFGAAKKIFMRKHVVNPSLKLGAIGAVIAMGGTIQQLCYAYVIAVSIGVVISFWLLGKVAREEGVSIAVHKQPIEYPVRELMSFAFPLLVSNFILIAVGTMDAIMLEQLRSTTEVAGLRAVYKIAFLNQLVASSFTSLYLPTASRAFASQDGKALNTGYWQTASWVAVLTFPVFALTCMGAESLVNAAYGPRYDDASILLTILAIGFYVNAMFGFNALTIKVYGRIRYILGINIVAGLFAVGANLLLIPPYGARGAALGTLMTMLLLFAMKHYGLWRHTDVAAFSRKLVPVYGMIVLLSAALFAFNYFVGPPLWANVILTGIATIGLLAFSRKAMKIDSTFPELRRIPILGPMFSR